jgi:hypothetical protein
MPGTVTIEIPDAFVPLLDKVLARWVKEGKPPELTLWNMLRHGIEMMDIGERPEPGDLPGGLREDIPPF